MEEMLINMVNNDNLIKTESSSLALMVGEEFDSQEWEYHKFYASGDEKIGTLLNSLEETANNNNIPKGSKAVVLLGFSKEVTMLDVWNLSEGISKYLMDADIQLSARILHDQESYIEIEILAK